MKAAPFKAFLDRTCNCADLGAADSPTVQREVGPCETPRKAYLAFGRHMTFGTPPEVGCMSLCFNPASQPIVSCETQAQSYFPRESAERKPLIFSFKNFFHSIFSTSSWSAAQEVSLFARLILKLDIRL